MKIYFILIFIFLTTKALACDCKDCNEKCNFNTISNETDFVILGKIKSFSDLDENTLLPKSMTIEIIKTYKGKNEIKEIKIWNGQSSQCIESINKFQLETYYLMAPQKLGNNPMKLEIDKNFEFSTCIVDYIKVDLSKGIGFGEYNGEVTEIELTKFENELHK